MRSFVARFSYVAAALMAAIPFPISAEHVWIEGEDATSSNFNRHGWYERTDLRFDLMSPGEVEVADGDWLAHYSSGDPSDSASATFDFNVTEGGSYTWWLRCNPTWAAHRYQVDGGPIQTLDLSDPRERVNIVVTIEIRWLAWVEVAELDLAPGAHSVTVLIDHYAPRNETHGGIDAMVFIDQPWEPDGIVQPDQVIAAPGPATWFPLQAGDDPLDPSSLTDMSRFVPAPAGGFGPLQRDGASFVFRDRPGEPVKLWGVNTGRLLPTAQLIDQQAKLYRKHGINLIRFHPTESFLGPLVDDGNGGRELDPVRLDAFDRWFSIFKANGLYVCLSFFYPHEITPDDNYPANLYAELDSIPGGGSGKSSSGMVAFMTQLQDAEWDWAREFLSHVNPYTGLAYYADPALAIVETHNEDSIFWHWPLNPLRAGGAYPLHTTELKRQWMVWVAARYSDDLTLAAAWGAGMRAGDSVASPDMDIYGAWQMAADGPDWGLGPVVAERPRLGDFIRFLAEAQRDYYQRRYQRVRGLGYDGVIVTTAWMAGGPAAEAANLWSDDVGDALDRHAYFGGGAGGHQIAVGNVSNGSHIDIPGRGIVGGHTYDAAGERVVLFQVEDKPTIMSEWTMSPPNQWKAEAAPLWAFYGMGLQGWDASIHFAASRPRLASGWPWDARAPSSYVTETPHYLGQFPALVFAIHNGHVSEADLVAARRLTVDDIFQGIDALSRDLAGGGYPSEPSLRTPPEVMAIGRLTFKADPGLPSSAKVDWDSYWDQTAQTILSTTGELRWDYGNRVVTVESEKTQAVIGFAGGRTIDLPGVTVESTTNFVSLIFTPLDDRPLDQSQQILVTALARDRQLNATYSGDGSQLLQVGGPPLLLEPVQATLTFNGAAITAAEVVDPHGVRTGTPVPVAGNAITIDGTFETYYYEVRRDAPDRCLCRTQADAITPLNPARAALFVTSPSPQGITLEPSAIYAEVPYACAFQATDPDPEPVLAPGGRPLLIYQLTDAPGPIRLVKDGATSSLRVYY